MSARIYGPGSKRAGLKSERKRMGPNGGIEFQFTQNLEFSGPFCEIWSAKLTNHRGSNKRDTKTSINNIVVSSLQYCFDRPAKGQIIDIHNSQLETSQSQWKNNTLWGNAWKVKAIGVRRPWICAQKDFIAATTSWEQQNSFMNMEFLCLNRGHQQANGNVSNQHAQDYLAYFWYTSRRISPLKYLSVSQGKKFWLKKIGKIG